LRQAYDYWQDQPGNSCKKEQEKKMTDRLRALSKSLPFFFSSPEQQKKIAALDQEVLLGMIVFNPKRCFLRFNTCL